MEKLYSELQALIQDNNVNLNSKLNKLHIKLADKSNGTSSSTAGATTTTEKYTLSLKASHKLASLYAQGIQQYSKQLDLVQQLLALVNQELGLPAQNAAAAPVEMQRLPTSTSLSGGSSGQQQRKRKKSMDIKEPHLPSASEKGHKKSRT
jgi:hypothetical protein